MDVGRPAALPFPKSLPEFQQLFPNDAACAEYLALFGAGAALLGAWITELNNRRSATEEKSRRQSEARQYLAPHD
jgi:hypothetical protein